MDPVTPPPPTPTAPQPAPPTPPATTPPSPTGVNKTKTILVVGGVIVVLFLALGGGYYFMSLKKSPVVPAPVANSQPAPEPQETPLTLQLTSPQEGEVAASRQITVRGKTVPNATVAVYTDSDQTSVQSSATGDFEATVSLQGGLNTLTVTAFDDSGQEQSVSMEVVYDQTS